MGTRNSTLVQVDGEYKVAQYCQWDGYPEGKGLGILEFLKEFDPEKIVDKFRNLKSISGEEVNNLWERCEANDPSNNTSATFKAKYPHLHRDTGGRDILSLIVEEKTDTVFLDLDFPKDSLWCEWCYVLDFDKMTFEVYKGYNKIPINEEERFYSPDVSIETRYYPVKLLVSFDINKLPSNDQFLAIIEERLNKIIS